MGKKFYNTDVQRLIRKHDINYYSTYSVLKASVVERFNCTLKNDMWKMLTLNGTYKWVDPLPRLVSVYNARKHHKYKTILEKGYTPNWTTEVKVVEVQRTNSITYLLEDYRGKSIARAFHEYKLHRTTYLDVYLVKKATITEASTGSRDK
ncbi:uncharacterized protein [Polyergus mexicanus]|uniref:uncharacterized protein n=1 Tax=Polyergus mexicanus TaxID=615972 RepID=UPI0038B580AC